jgi:hypothetical protein
MTPNPSLLANPFALLMDPEAVFRAIEKSERLVRLQSRICRPLDKPLLPPAEGGEAAPAVDPFQDLPGSPC